MSGVDFGPLSDLPLGVKKVVLSLAADRGRCLVLDADGHRAAWGPSVLEQPGVEAVVLPAEGPEWVCDACGVELDRSCPIPVDDGWALCRGCAVEWGFPGAWLDGGGAAVTCPCEPCSAVASGLDVSHRRGLLLRAGRLA